MIGPRLSKKRESVNNIISDKTFVCCNFIYPSIKRKKKNFNGVNHFGRKTDFCYCMSIKSCPFANRENAMKIEED